MKHSQLKQLIKEEIRNTISEESKSLQLTSEEVRRLKTEKLWVKDEKQAS